MHCRTDGVHGPEDIAACIRRFQENGWGKFVDVFSPGFFKFVKPGQLLQVDLQVGTRHFVYGGPDPAKKVGGLSLTEETRVLKYDSKTDKRLIRFSDGDTILINLAMCVGDGVLVREWKLRDVN